MSNNDTSAPEVNRVAPIVAVVPGAVAYHAPAPLIVTAENAEQIGLERRHLNRAAREGCPHWRAGDELVFSVARLLRWIEENSASRRETDEPSGADAPRSARRPQTIEERAADGLRQSGLVPTKARAR